jgi:hypothetical protein
LVEEIQENDFGSQGSLKPSIPVYFKCSLPVRQTWTKAKHRTGI